MSTFSTIRNASMLSFHALCRSRNQIVCDFGELGRIRQIVDHECGNRLIVVQRYISALLNRGTHMCPTETFSSRTSPRTHLALPRTLLVSQPVTGCNFETLYLLSRDDAHGEVKRSETGLVTSWLTLWAVVGPPAS